MSAAEKMADEFYKRGYSVCEGFVTAAEAEQLRRLIEDQRGSLQKAGIGSKKEYLVNKAVRGDFIQWIDDQKHPLFYQVYMNKLQPIIDLFNKRFFLGINSNEHHMAYYPPGTHYEKHVDTFRNSDARVVSTVLYLNSDWKPGDGGELIIYPETGEPQKIEPFAGRLVLFESILPHEVLTSHSHRYSITGWFKRNTPF